MRRTLILLAILLSLCCGARQAQAEIVTYRFGGVITGVSSSSVPFREGTSTFIGTLTFDDSAMGSGPWTPQTNGDLTVLPAVYTVPPPGVVRWVSYLPSLAQMSVTIDGDYSLSLNANGEMPPWGARSIAVATDRDGSTAPGQDSFLLKVNGYQHVVPLPVFYGGGGTDFPLLPRAPQRVSESIQLNLGGHPSLFDDDPLSTLADVEKYFPLLYARTMSMQAYYFTSTPGSLTAQLLNFTGAITSFERDDALSASLVVAIPEPASWLLLAIGGATVCFVGGRRRGRTA